MKVEIKKEQGYGGAEKYSVLTSHNGWQWSGGGLMSLDDIKNLRDELTKFLTQTNSTQDSPEDVDNSEAG